MASATWQVSLNGGAFAPIDGGVNAAPGDVVTMRLASTTGVQSVSVRCYGTHAEAVSTASIEALWTLGGAPRGSEVTWTIPAGVGQAYGIEFTVNGGRQGRDPMAAWISRGGIYVLAGNGERLIFAGETTEASATHGYVERLNGAIDGSGGGAVSSVFGRTGAVVATAGDYDASDVTNDSSVSGATVKDALETLLSGGGLTPPTDPGDDYALAVAYGGDLTYLAPGTNGHWLTMSAGAPTWAALPTLLTPPASPGDNGKVAVAASGNLTYVTPAWTNADIAVGAAIAGSKVVPDFGSQQVKGTAGLDIDISSGSHVLRYAGTAIATFSQYLLTLGGAVHTSGITMGGAVPAIAPASVGGAAGRALTISGGPNNHATLEAGKLVLRAGANSGAGPDGDIEMHYPECIERRHTFTRDITGTGAATVTIPITDNKRAEVEFRVWCYSTAAPGTDNLFIAAGGVLAKSGGALSIVMGTPSNSVENGDAANWSPSHETSSGDLTIGVDLGGSSTTDARMVVVAIVREIVA